MFAVLKHLFKFQFLIILLAVIAGIYYPQLFAKIKSIFLDTKEQEEQNNQLFTPERLSKYNGENDYPIYLSILGTVFDVTKGKKHYGPGGSYHYFVGKDASKSFVTGVFDEYKEDSDDVIDLSPNDLISLENWKKFYDTEYTYKGKLIGRYYDNNGDKTKYHHKLDFLVEQAKEVKFIAENFREKYPDCNIEWSEILGTRVWCTTKSGGKERTWTGYPRKFYKPGDKNFRCACIHENDLKNTAIMIESYENCDPESLSCHYHVE